MRMLTIIGGVLMLLTGIFCFINPGQTFLAIAFVIGLVMVLNGLIHICAYMMGRGLNNKGDNNGTNTGNNTGNNTAGSTSGTNAGTTSSDKAAKTGDTTPLILWGATAMLAAGAVVTVVTRRRKRR